jgi:YHS domain-containing protein
MIRGFLLEFVFPLLLVLILRSLLSNFLSSFRGRGVVRRQNSPGPPAAPTAELMKDPVCGTYVSAGASVSRMVKGHLLYFCSAECRDKYVG